jgi:hypothetical protein
VLQIDGDLQRIPPNVREQLVETLGAALRSVEGGQVTLTILCSGESGTGYVSFPVAEGSRAPWPDGSAASSGPPASAASGPSVPSGSTPPSDSTPPSGSSVRSDQPPAVAINADVEDGLACLELRWPAEAAAS